LSKKTVDFLRHDGSVPWRTRHPAGYSSPSAPGQKRAQPRIYGRTKKECLDNLVEASGYVTAGRPVAGRSTKFGEHLDRRLRWWGSEGDVKPSTLESYREAADLYLRPALGHLRIADLNPDLFRDLAAAMRKINGPEVDEDRSDLMRRLLAARATRDDRRYSTRPLTDASSACWRSRRRRCPTSSRMSWRSTRPP
jgi:hypothetical protein